MVGDRVRVPLEDVTEGDSVRLHDGDLVGDAVHVRCVAVGSDDAVTAERLGDGVGSRLRVRVADDDSDAEAEALGVNPLPPWPPPPPSARLKW